MTQTSTPTSPTSRGRVRTEPGHKRGRAYLAGGLVADSTRPVLGWETPYYPSYYLPVEDVRAEIIPARQARILVETGLPPRYYVPITDVRMELLRPSATQTHCPYKGMATYWSVDSGRAVHTDLIWIYRAPFPESQKIAGLASFYNEKVDLSVDGVLQERPRTHFSC